MAIIPKQIGWSQESNLIWELLRQLDQLTKVTSTSGGGGGCGDCPVTTDGVTITGDGTIADPLVATAGIGLFVVNDIDIGSMDYDIPQAGIYRIIQGDDAANYFLNFNLVSLIPSLTGQELTIINSSGQKVYFGNDPSVFPKQPDGSNFNTDGHLEPGEMLFLKNVAGIWIGKIL